MIRYGLLLASLFSFGSATAGLLAPTAAQAQQTDVSRRDLQRHDISIPGRETIQTIVTLGPHAAAPKHRHPGEEVIFVLKGSIEYDVEGRPPVVLKRGDCLFIPYGVAHSARNTSGGSAAELATYIVEKDRQLVQPVQ